MITVCFIRPTSLSHILSIFMHFFPFFFSESLENTKLSNWDLETSYGLVTLHANYVPEPERFTSMPKSYKCIYQ